MLKIVAHRGRNAVGIGQVIAVIGKRELSTNGPSTKDASTNDASSPARAPTSSTARVSSTATPPLGHDGRRLNVSPVALRLAREQGIDLSVLQGSGPGGRIVRADVEAAAAEVARAPYGAEADQPPPSDRVAMPAPSGAAPLPPPRRPAAGARPNRGERGQG